MSDSDNTSEVQATDDYSDSYNYVDYRLATYSSEATECCAVKETDQQPGHSPYPQNSSEETGDGNTVIRKLLAAGRKRYDA
jgi:hypothetical protein